MTGDETRGEEETPTDVARLADAEGAEVEALAQLIVADTDEPMWSAVVIAKHILASDWLARRDAARDRARDAEVRRVVEQICANLRGFDGEEGHPGEFISVNEAQRIALDALAEIEEGS